jgi:hypothetical protein
VGQLTVLTDGTIRYADGEKPVIEFPRSAWTGNLTNVRGLVNGWLTTNKLTGWTVTITSIAIPPAISITTNPTKSV